MKDSIKKGFSFGLTSGVITTLGLIIGLWATTESKVIIIGGIFIIAIADALSDSMGMHISEESKKRTSEKHIWEATFATFFSKLVFALSFAIPIFLLNLGLAMIVSVIWGLFLISCLSFYISKKDKISRFKVIAEHVILTAFVVLASYCVGKLVRSLFVIQGAVAN